MTKNDKQEIYDKLFFEPEGEIREVFNPDNFNTPSDEDVKVLDLDGEHVRYFLDWCEGENVDISKSSIRTLFQQYKGYFKKVEL